MLGWQKLAGCTLEADLMAHKFKTVRHRLRWAKMGSNGSSWGLNESEWGELFGGSNDVGAGTQPMVGPVLSA